MMRKLLFGTTAAIALTLGGHAFAQSTSTVDITGNSGNDSANAVDVIQSAGANDSEVTISNFSDGNNVLVDQANGDDQSSDVTIDLADGNAVGVDQDNNTGGTRAIIEIQNNSFDNGTTGDRILVTQVGNDDVDGRITIDAGSDNFASIFQRDSDTSVASVDITGDGNTRVLGNSIVQDDVSDSEARVEIAGNSNITSIRQTTGTTLVAFHTITGDSNEVFTDQDGETQTAHTTIEGSLNTTNVFQTGENQTSTIDALSGSDDNTITVDQFAGNNTSTIELANADLNTVTHTQSTNGLNEATTNLTDSNNNVVNVTQN